MKKLTNEAMEDFNELQSAARRFDTILLAISQETSRSNLSQMSVAIEDRKRALAKLAVSALVIGDTVSFNDKIRPTYLKGLTAKVIGINRESISVRCPDDPRYGRFRNSRNIRLPLGLLGGKVDQPTA